MLNRLKRWLDETDTTQKVLAERCALTPAAISQYIRGTSSPSVDTLKVLSRETGLSTDELLFDLPPVVRGPRSNRASA